MNSTAFIFQLLAFLQDLNDFLYKDHFTTHKITVYVWIMQQSSVQISPS